MLKTIDSATGSNSKIFHHLYFLLAIISSLNSFHSFSSDFLCLFGSVTGSAVVSGVRSRVGILSVFFTGNHLLLKLLRTFSLILINSPKLF